MEKKPKRGGRRPGAGAPKGNLNALKHGHRSRQLAALGALLAANPKTRDALLQIAERLEGKQNTADQTAADLLSRLYQHAHDIAAGKPSPGPFARYLRLNAEVEALNDAQSTKKTRRPRRRNTASAKTQENAEPTINPQAESQEDNQIADLKSALNRLIDRL